MNLLTTELDLVIKVNILSLYYEFVLDLSFENYIWEII